MIHGSRFFVKIIWLCITLGKREISKNLNNLLLTAQIRNQNLYLPCNFLRGALL
jgi:hypothetical protein